MDPKTQFRTLLGISFLARFSYALARTPVLPLFALALGAGPEAIGLAVGISTVTGILFKLPSGALSDIIGRRSTLLAGLCVFALVPFGYLFVGNYIGLVAIRFAHGFATAIYGPAAMAVVADLAGERRGEMLSWFSSVGIVGTVLGAPIGGLLLAQARLPGASAAYASWAFPTVYALCGVLGLGALLIGLRALPKPEAPVGAAAGEGRKRFFSGIRAVLADRRVVFISSMEGLQNLCMGALEAFLPIYAVTVAGLSAFQAGLLWAAQIVVTLLSKPLMGKISDRYGRKPLIVAGLVLCGASFAVIPLLTGIWPLLFASLAFGLGEALVTSSTAALVADVSDLTQIGTAMGVFGTIFDVGHAAGPILGGLLIGAFGYIPAFFLLGGLLLIAAPWFAGRVREDRPVPGEACGCPD